ncbi:MAG: N-acetyltransferase family protein, partial [Gemmatimonadota bacterium]
MDSDGVAGRAAEATDVVLRDGSTVRVRPARDEDEAGLLAFLRELSPDSVARRFAGSLSTERLRERASDMAAADGDGTFALVATSGDDRIVGHAVYAGTEDG